MKTFKKQQGFNLLELFIAMALGLLIIAMVLSVYVTGATTSRGVDNNSLLIENGRYAIQRLSDEIQMAGYYGNVDFRTNVSSLLTEPNFCTYDKANIERAMNVPVWGDEEVGPSTYACLGPVGQTTKSTTDTLVIRRANSNSIDVATLTSDDDDTFFIQAKAFDSIVADGANKADFSLMQKDNATLQEVRRFEHRLFYVNTNDELRMATFEDAAISTELIAEGVENFQLDYGIDTTGNGSPNGAYIRSPKYVAGLGIPQQLDMWTRVSAIRIHLLLRTDDAPAGMIDTKVYDLGTGGTVGPFNDNVRRQLFTSTVRVNNISMRSE